MVEKTFSVSEMASLFLYQGVIDSEENWRILIFCRNASKGQTNELCRPDIQVDLTICQQIYKKNSSFYLISWR